MQLKILIVDDDLELMTALGRTFTTTLRGYLVLTATTANAGLTMLKEERPDIVILDVRLGTASGMDLLEDFYGYLASRAMQYKPRFIVITAYPDESVKRQALENYKVDAFVMKPFNAAEIKQTVIESILMVLASEYKTLCTYGKKAENDIRQSKDRLDKRIQEGLKETQEEGESTSGEETKGATEDGSNKEGRDEGR